MVKIPQTSGKELVKVLQKLGFVVVKQTGSHVKLVRRMPTGTETVIVPNHKTLKKGTFHSILRYTKLSLHDFLRLRK